MELKDLSKEFNINITQVDKFLDILTEANKKINLTSILDRSEMIDKHIYDSLLISKIFDFSNKNILDVGSGGGFPGIPLAMLFPNAHFILLDSTKKKCDYLKDTVNKLNLLNVEVINARVEEIKEYKEKFDVIIARAVSELKIYLELTAYLAKVGGNIIALKGSKASEEIDRANNIIKQLGLSLDKVQSTHLFNGDKRMNLIFKKIKTTPNKYPREYKEIVRP